jgi:hypothetical protein
MADAAWRCSHCGTVNAPAANACRTCGHWPSLFDLESSTVESSAAESPSAPAPAREEPEVYQPETVDGEPPAPPEPVTVEDPEAELPHELEADETMGRKQGWQRFVRLVVPIGVAIYVLVNVLANR